MPVEFDPVLTEMTQRGTTAAMLLDAQRRMSATCVEEVLKKIDRAVESSATTPELAMDAGPPRARRPYAGRAGHLQ
jgi:hypothetical protein